MIPLEEEQHYCLSHRVEEQDSASYWGNDAPVLATPILLWLGEIASMKAIEANLAPDEMTVGIAHEARHLAPTPVGAMVRVNARFIEQTGQRLRFRIEALDDEELIYQGTHERGLVKTDRFFQRVAQKRERLTNTAREEPFSREGRQIEESAETGIVCS